MTNDWLLPVISAAAGIGGALAGGGGLLLNGRFERTAARRAHRSDSLVSLYEAAAAYASFAGREKSRRGPIAELSFRLEERMQTGVLLQRMFAVTDRYWRASGHARTVARKNELAVITKIERIVARTEFFQPLPPEWAPAFKELQALLTVDQIAMRLAELERAPEHLPSALGPASRRPGSIPIPG